MRCTLIGHRVLILDLDRNGWRRENVTAYFFRLENNRLSTSLLKLSILRGQSPIILRQLHISVQNFTVICIKKTFSEEAAHTFLESVKDCKTISSDDRNLCDNEMTLSEVSNSILELKNNKSPRTDGLTTEFYKQFSNELSPFLLKVLEESIQNETLPPTLTKGLITLNT